MGLPICFLLSALNGFRFNYHRYPLSPPKKIMVLKFWGIGSIVLAHPLLRSLKARYPEAEITLATLTSNRELKDLIGEIDSLILLDLSGSIFNHFWQILHFIFKVRRARFDLVFDLEFFTRFSAIVTFLSGARDKVGFHTWTVWRGHLHTLEIPFNRYWHISKNFENLLGEPDPTEVGQLAPEVIERGGKLLQVKLQTIAGGSLGAYVVFNVNAGELAMERRWSPKSFAELADLLSVRQGLTPVLVGSASEKTYVDSVISLMESPKSAVNLAGQTSLLEMTALFAQARLVVSNDSGPLHLASAVGVPTVSFFGPETPLLYGPRAEQHRVFFADLDCSPCINAETAKTPLCRYEAPECLRSITVAEVYRWIEETLGTPGTPRGSS